MEQVIAVLDIGKTNKKVAFYDEQMKLVSLESESFPAVPFKDVRVEQVEAIEGWFLEVLEKSSKKYEVVSISITTHGAAAVCLDENGSLTVPPLDYTTEVDEDVHEAFFRKLGSREALQKETCTAEIRPIINVAKMLFFASRHFPAEFAKTRHILLYPQYFAWRLTGKMLADYTYAGCHTYLWDFSSGSWSSVADELGIRDALPERVTYPGEVAGTLTESASRKSGLPVNTPVLTGVHDSNSSLIPYLLQEKQDFLLNSTGTWCVAMHPEEKAEMKEEDLGNTVFFNLSVSNTPVKTAIFMGGLEFERWFTLLQNINGRNDYPPFDAALVNRVIRENRQVILPGVVQGAGQFPESNAGIVCDGIFTPLEAIESGDVLPEVLGNYEKGFAILLLSLALHTEVAFKRAGLRRGTPVYTEGGFRNNKGYNQLIASLFPENSFFTTGIDEATSFGAALLGWAQAKNRSLESLSPLAKFVSIPVEPAEIEPIHLYRELFFSFLN